MAFVDDDKIKEISVVMLIPQLAALIRGERLKDREKDRRVFRHTAPLGNSVGANSDARAVLKRPEGIIGLAGKDVAIREKQYARAARRFAA